MPFRSPLLGKALALAMVLIALVLSLQSVSGIVAERDVAGGRSPGDVAARGGRIEEVSRSRCGSKSGLATQRVFRYLLQA